MAGGVRDLSPAQRAALGSNEIAARLPGAHAEVTAIMAAIQVGLRPTAMGVSRPICLFCIPFIVRTGGRITSPTTVVR